MNRKIDFNLLQTLVSVALELACVDEADTIIRSISFMHGKSVVLSSYLIERFVSCSRTVGDALSKTLRRKMHLLTLVDNTSSSCALLMCPDTQVYLLCAFRHKKKRKKLTKHDRVK